MRVRREKNAFFCTRCFSEVRKRENKYEKWKLKIPVYYSEGRKISPPCPTAFSELKMHFPVFWLLRSIVPPQMDFLNEECVLFARWVHFLSEKYIFWSKNAFSKWKMWKIHFLCAEPLHIPVQPAVHLAGVEVVPRPISMKLLASSVDRKYEIWYAQPEVSLTPNSTIVDDCHKLQNGY